MPGNTFTSAILQLQHTIGNHAVRQLMTSPEYTPPSNNVIQQKKTLTSDKMVELAEELAPNSQGTVAIAKDGDKYYVFTQANIGAKKDIIANYTNVSMGEEGAGKPKGYHAEMRAIDHELDWSHIAANNPVCIRCERALTTFGKTPVNRGGHYTKDWLASNTDTDVPVGSTFPGKAQKDKSMNGQSGTRYTKSKGSLSAIPKSEWSLSHPGGW